MDDDLPLRGVSEADKERYGRAYKQVDGHSIRDVSRMWKEHKFNGEGSKRDVNNGMELQERERERQREWTSVSS